MLQQLAGGMVVSVEIFVVTLVFSLPLGLLICFGRMSKNPVIRGIVSAYISIMRGTPLMLQLMVVYFGPYFIFGIRISMGYSLIAVFIAFSINYAAYFAEIYRGGIESISTGQYEAAKILGYSKAQTFFRIILPQMKSPIVVLVIYQFMSCWNEFNLALIMLTKNQIKTLPLGLVNFWTAYQAQWGQVGAAMIMASVPVLVIYLFFSNQITDAMSTSGMKN